MASSTNVEAPDAGSEYYLGELIGYGAFGVVHLGTHKSDHERVVVIKKIFDSDPKKEDVNVLKHLKHERIIQILESYVDSMGTLCLVLEKAEKSSLTKLLGSNGTPTVELNVWRFLSHLSSGLAYLHSMNILHQDLNPDNIMAVRAWSKVAKDYRTDWKLADFSTPTLLNKEARERFYNHVRGGGQVYWAPEVLKYPEDYCPQSDIWSLGAVISTFCNQGTHLFTNMQEVLDWTGGSSLTSNYTEELREIQGKMLARDIGERSTAKELSEECTAERQAIKLDAKPDKEVAMKIDTEGLAVQVEMEQNIVDNKDNNSSIDIRENGDYTIPTASHPEDISKENEEIASFDNQINGDLPPIKKERKKKKKKSETQLRDEDKGMMILKKNDELEMSTEVNDNKPKKSKKKKKDKKDKDKEEHSKKKSRVAIENDINVSPIPKIHELQTVPQHKTNGTITSIPNGHATNVSRTGSVPDEKQKHIDTQNDMPLTENITKTDIQMDTRMLPNVTTSIPQKDTISCASDTLTRRKKQRAPIPQMQTPVQGAVEPVYAVINKEQQLKKKRKKKAPLPPDVHTHVEMQSINEIEPVESMEKEHSSLSRNECTEEITEIVSSLPRNECIEEITKINSDNILTPIPKERKKKKKNKTKSIAENNDVNVMQESITSFASEESIDSGVDVIETPPTSECSQDFPNHSDHILRSDIVLDNTEMLPDTIINDTIEEHTDDTLKYLIEERKTETPSDAGIEELELEDTICDSPVSMENFDSNSDVDLNTKDLKSPMEEVTKATFDEKLMMSEDDEIISADKAEFSSAFTENYYEPPKNGIIYWEKTCQSLENIDDFSLDNNLDTESDNLENIPVLDVEFQEVKMEFEEESKDIPSSEIEHKIMQFDVDKSEKLNSMKQNDRVHSFKEDIQITENIQENSYPSNDEKVPKSIKNVIKDSMSSGEYNAIQHNLTKKVSPKHTMVEPTMAIITLQTWGERSSQSVTIQTDNHQAESSKFWEDRHQYLESAEKSNSSSKSTVEASLSSVNVPIHSYKPVKTENFIKKKENTKKQPEVKSNDLAFQVNGIIQDINKKPDIQPENSMKQEETMRNQPEVESNHRAVQVNGIKKEKNKKSSIKPENSIKQEESMRKPSKVESSHLYFQNNDIIQEKRGKSSINNFVEDQSSKTKHIDEETDTVSAKPTGNVFSSILKDFDEKRQKKLSEIKILEKPIIKPKPDISKLSKTKKISNGLEETDSGQQDSNKMVKSNIIKPVTKDNQGLNDNLEKSKSFYLDALPNQTRKTSYAPVSKVVLPKGPRKTSMGPFVTHNWRPAIPKVNENSENRDQVKPYTTLSWRYNENRKISEDSKQNDLQETNSIQSPSPTPAPRLSVEDTNKIPTTNNTKHLLDMKNEAAPWDIFMDSIQRGAKLKPVVTNDRSSPMVTRKLKKLQPVDIYDDRNSQHQQDQAPPQQKQGPHKPVPHQLLQDTLEPSQVPSQPAQVPLPPPQVPTPPPKGPLKSPQGHQSPSPQPDNGDLLRAIQTGKKLKPVSKAENRKAEQDEPSNFLKEIRDGKKLKSVQCNDRSGPMLRTGKYS